jgi:hypothetical protein
MNKPIIVAGRGGSPFFGAWLLTLLLLHHKFLGTITMSYFTIFSPVVIVLLFGLLMATLARS